ncbi:LytR/AlgR family response regulator transcription factor [Alloscardovia omnicolens]|uniref:LytR/AlgR family response regulator transcription factor n=1 Tax=Alloscardovia omnicolens TaxID=419015 RepID=UPI003A68047D
MISIALVEDTEEDALVTHEAIERFMEQSHQSTAIKRFVNAQDFLNAARSQQFDLVFMDIEMPGDDGQGMDGMTAASLYRQQSPTHAQIPLIFTTKVAQLAAQGYEVSAVGYLIKPFDYATFALTMKRAMAQVELNVRDVTLTLTSSEGTYFVSSHDITHIEVRDHLVYVYFLDGTVRTVWGTLKEYAALLEPVHFVQCHRYCLVNMQCVTGFNDKELLIHTDAANYRVDMSRGKKQQVLDALLAMKSGL